MTHILYHMAPSHIEIGTVSLPASKQQVRVRVAEVRKGKEEYLYSAIYNLLRKHSLKALRHGSHSFRLQITPCLLFFRNRSPDGATHN